MPVITLPDGSKKEFDGPVTVREVAESIGAGLARAALAGKVDGQVVDTSFSIESDADVGIVTDKDPEGLEVIRHSTAHLLAQAVKDLFPEAQVTIGPVIEDGFYYDFAFERPFTPEDLEAIEKKMAMIAKADLKISRRVMPRQEAVDFFRGQGEIYKAEIIEGIPETEEIGLYGQGDWVDLCRGPHVPSTGKLKAFKLTKLAGAYWRGDSNNEMLQRTDIYQNVVAMNAALVWDTGNFGQDSLAVIIDTGIYDQHFMLAGGVVGGIDISTDVGTAFEGFNLATNHWHGTHVSGTLAGHGAIIIPNDDLLTQSIELYSGTPLPAYDANNKILPLLGMAPAAQLYGIKVFPHTGAGTSTSTIIAAIEHAIDLKVSGTLDVDVINMSLGGANLFDGRDLEDQVIDMATFYDITVVVAASNDGPTSMTIQSPGTANTAVTVGATADPVQVRTFWDQNFGLLGIGQFLFVDDNTQIVYFSSRGPTADGRDKPTASANGSFVLSSFNTAAAPQSIAFSSGTSMATPGMAGVAALLNTYGESMGASPYDYKQAIISGSLPVPGFDKYDQGAGVVNAAAAMAALQADAELGSAHPDLSNGYSANSVKPKGTFIQGLNGKNGRTIQVNDLPPGYQQHYYFHVHPNTEQITIDFTNVDLGADPFGLNSFEVYLQSSTRSLNNSYLDTANVWGDASFVIGNLSTTADGAAFGVVTQDLPLMPGEMRLVIENDWTSFDAISATVNINQVSGNESDKPDESYSGTLNTGESDGFFPVGFGPGGVELSLSWDGDWSRYPTSDMDLIVAWFDTGGNLSFEFAAATLNSNEMMRIESGDVSAVFVLVDGFDTNGVDENWDLAVQHLN